MKKRHVISLLIIVAACLRLAAQTKTIDSLVLLLKESKNDTNRVNRLNLLARQLVKDNPDSAIALTSTALRLAQQNKWVKHEAISCHNLSTMYLEISEPEKALDAGLKAMECWAQLEKSGDMNRSNLYRKTQTMSNVASIKQTLGRSDEAEELFKQVEQNFETLHTRRELLGAYTNYGNLLNRLARYPEALEKYFKALKIAREDGFEKSVAHIYSNVGVIYIEQKEFEKGLGYFEKALQQHKDLNNERGMISVLGNLGGIYGRQATTLKDTVVQRQLNDKALAYFEKALALSEKLGIRAGMAVNLGNMGNIYFYYSQLFTQTKPREFYLKKALDTYERARQLSEELNDRLGVAEKLGNIGILYTALNQFAAAESNLKKAIVITQKTGALQSESFYYGKLSDLYKKKGDYTQALGAFKKYVALNDSISNDENTTKQTRAEMSYEFDKKEAISKAEHEKELELQQAIAKTERQRQNLFLWLVAFIALAVITVTAIIVRSLRMARRQKLIIEQQKVVMEEKQQAIIDSIHYARKIQSALVTSEKYIEREVSRLNR